MPNCVVCRSPYVKGTSFHRFPRNDELRKKWIDAMNLSNRNVITDKKLICKRHFDKTCFHGIRDKYPLLRRNAVPSLHPYVPFIPPTPPIADSKNEIDNRVSVTIVVTQENLCSFIDERDEKERIEFSKAIEDMTDDDFGSVNEREIHPESIELCVRQLRTQNQHFQELNGFYEKTIKSFKELLNYLKEKHFISDNTHH